MEKQLNHLPYQIQSHLTHKLLVALVILSLFSLAMAGLYFDSSNRFKCVDAVVQMANTFVERDDLAHGLMLALLSKNHVFLLGPPGTAKSVMVEAMPELFDDEDMVYWDYLMTKFTEPNELFGALDYNEMIKGKYLRVTKGYLPEAHLVFLDEVFKANSAILNSLLSALDPRRRLKFGSTVHELPMELCVGASNEIPKAEELAALYDRFLIRYEVRYIKDRTKLRQLMHSITMGGGLPEMNGSLTRDLLDIAREAVKATGVDPSVYEMLCEIRERFDKEGIPISDRRLIQCIPVIQAEAWLSGDETALPAHCAVLKDMLWSDPTAKGKVAKIVLRLCDPITEELMTIVTNAQEACKDALGAGANNDIGLKTNKLLGQFKRNIIDLKDKAHSSRDKAKLVKGAQLIASLNAAVCAKCFNLDHKTEIRPAWELQEELENLSSCEATQDVTEEFATL